MQKNKKKWKKIGPDIGLHEKEVMDINKEFYKEYSRDYFKTKLTVLISMISKSSKILEVIKNEDPLKVGVLEIGVEEDNFQKETLVNYAKLELSTTYYHCLETFLRIFLAHIKFEQCPWLEISRETSFVNFKKKLKELADGKFNFTHDKLSVDEMILYIFYGMTDISSLNTDENKLTSEEAVSILKRWIIWASEQLISVYDYNAFKHGLTVFTGNRGITIGDVEDKHLREQGDALKLIVKKEKSDRWVWEKKIIFTPLDARGAIIYIVNDLINNILKVGEFTYLQKEYDNIVFLGDTESQPENFYKSIKTKNEFGIAIAGYSMGLLYYKRKT